ncbi:MAG: nucleotidyltransferase domain-containing protein, partial [Gammaproteobacteria bacterium]
SALMSPPLALSNATEYRALTRFIGPSMLFRDTPEDDRAAHDMEAIWADCDAGRLCELARRHGVLGHLGHSRLALERSGCPEAIQTEVTRATRAMQLRSLRQSSQLLTLLEAFASAGLRVIPLKGPVLSEQLFGSLTRRDAVDLDLLLHPTELEPAHELLLRLGYRSDDAPMTAGRYERHPRMRFFHEANYLPIDGDNFPVDLHWRLFQDPGLMPLSFDHLWETSERAEFEGRTVTRLPRPLLLTYLSCHGSVSCWFRMKWLCDVAALLATLSEEDARSLSAGLPSISARRAVGHAITLTGHELGIHSEALGHVFPESASMRDRWELRFLLETLHHDQFSQVHRDKALRLKQVAFKYLFYSGWTARWRAFTRYFRSHG